MRCVSVSVAVWMDVYAKMANGLLSTHVCECHAPQNTTTQPAAPSQQSAAQQLATGNNLKDTKRNGAVTGDPGKAGTRTRNLLMFELCLQFYQRNDINLKALRGLMSPRRLGQKTQKTQKRVKGGSTDNRLPLQGGGKRPNRDDNQRSLFMEK